MATLQNERDKTLQASVPRLVATTVVISSSAGALFVKPNAIDPIDPTGLTLTGDTTVFTIPVVIRWFYASNSDMVWHDYNITGSNIGPTRALTSADFISQLGATGTKVLYKATAEQPGFASAESPTFEIEYSDLSGSAGADGVDAYHIRLDNGTRIVRFDYTGTAISGQLPVNAQVYVSRGGVDITSGTGYVTYSILSVSGATGASVSATTGAVTVTGITQETNYVEIKAAITEPDMPAYDALIKLYITKFEDPSLEIDVDIAQDYYYFEYANATSTTNIAAWGTVTLTATVVGVPGGVVTWAAKTYTSAGTEIAGSETIFTASGNVATVSAAQFIARGGHTNARMVVTATYELGGASVTDYVQIIRNDGTLGTRYLFSSNYAFTLSGQTDGTISAGELASDGVATLQILNISTGTPVDDTTGWSFTATPSTGITVDINNTGNGPYVAGTPVTLRITAIDFGTLVAGATFSGTITIVATKATFPNVQTTLLVSATLPGVGGAYLDVSPDKTILLPVDNAGNIIGYGTARRTIKVMNGSNDDTSNWGISIVNGPGVTADYTAGTVRVTDFITASTSIVFSEGGSGTFTGTIVDITRNSNFAHNGSGTFVVQIISSYVNTPPIMMYSTDYGVTWTKSASVAVPPTTYGISSGLGSKLLTYSAIQNKFVFSYYSPLGSGNARVIHSSTGATWTASTVSNLPVPEAWGYAGVITDTATGRVYTWGRGGSVIYYSDDMSSWTTINTGITAAADYNLSVHNGYGVFSKYGDNTNVKYSSNLASWTSNPPSPGNSDWSSRSLHNSDDFYIMPMYDSSGNSKGLSSKIGYSSSWKHTYSPSQVTSSVQMTFLRKNNNYYFLNSYGGGNLHIYVTQDAAATVSACAISGSNTASNMVTNSNVSACIGQDVITEGGVSYFPVIKVVPGSTNTLTYYKGLITEGNNGSESYITVTATPNDPTQSPLTATIIVRKGVYTGDVYTLMVNPGTIQLPATSDGVVYPSSFTNGTNTTTYSVLKNGVPYTGNITGSISASSGITASASGSSSTGTVTVSAMTTGTTDGTITGTVSIDGVLGQTLSLSIKVVKLKDGTTSGVRSGTTASAFTSTHTSIAIRFNPSGTFEIKRGAGSYVYAGDWYQPVNASSPPGSNYYMTMFYTSDTGDTLSPTGSATVNSATYVVLSAAQEWTLSNAVTGRHTIFLEPRIGTSTAGANAVIGSGKLELQVP